MNPRPFRLQRRLGTSSRGASLHIKIGAMVSVLGATLLAGCASTTSGVPATSTVTATPSVKVVIFNPATSGKVLAAQIETRAKPKRAGEKITGVECKNFPDISVGTHTDCQMRVDGVKRGFLVTFTLRPGHYVLKAQKLTW